ncbi:MAG TPA: type 4a pilus biogenesis protein PilO [Thermoanaerobaculia bacterium]|jgi:type IV pilus assembly protein PilO|nr:type 4a pilus biogenesis protein PilO [Thermoanaerobaculia bacterium]
MAGLSLDGKPWYYGLIVGLVLAVAIVWGVNYGFISGVDDQIRTADSTLKDLDTKIEQGRSAQRKMPQFREEVNRLKVELAKLRSILPSTRNTEEIIKKIKALVDAGNLVLLKLTFPKLAAPQGSDPYAEWPISVSVDGRYHNLATLFNHLSNFTRIVNVEQITIAAQNVQTDRTITAEFVAKTFVYVEPKEPEDTAKGAKK